MIPQTKRPYFDFPALPPYEELSFEKFTVSNFEQLYKMFSADANPFTDERFKHFEKAKEYAQFRELYGPNSPKHGGQDWLFLCNNEYSGILHLYDLSLETFAENNRRCWIGFATKPETRNKGVTKKVVLYFIQYIFDNYPLIKYIHSMTLKENVASQALLKSVGFKQDFTKRLSEEHAFYIMEKP